MVHSRSHGRLDSNSCGVTDVVGSNPEQHADDRTLFDAETVIHARDVGPMFKIAILLRQQGLQRSSHSG
ncbi:MAG TPA: hypothetical protein VHA57_09700 [Actinomycetota bacterium]|nr:hypothetical protein [Actinomycetota bacterium]